MQHREPTPPFTKFADILFRGFTPLSRVVSGTLCAPVIQNPAADAFNDADSKAV